MISDGSLRLLKGFIWVTRRARIVGVDGLAQTIHGEGAHTIQDVSIEQNMHIESSLNFKKD